MKWHWLALIASLGSAGCVASTVAPAGPSSAVETTRLNLPPYRLQARSPDSVEVYASTPPTRPHLDLALLRATSDSSAVETRQLVRSLLAQAGSLGCDALFVSGASERAGTPGTSRVIDAGSRSMMGTCILYSESLRADGDFTATSALRSNAVGAIATPRRTDIPSHTVDNAPYGAER